MVPYHKFLITVAVLPLSQEGRMELLEDCHCYGIDRRTLDRFMLDLASLLEDDFLKKYLSDIVRNNPTVYPKESCSGFAIDYGIDELYNHLIGNSEDKDLLAIMNMASKSQYVYFLLSLLLAEEEPEKISSYYLTRFKRNIPESAIKKFYFYFSDFGSLSERSIIKWIDSCPPRLCNLLRLALYEPSYKVMDELGIDCDLDVSFATSRIMTRSLRHFENLSKSKHHKAMHEAREWAKVSLSASDKYARSKQGNMTSFLGQFQLSLLEATDDMIDSHKEEE